MKSKKQLFVTIILVSLTALSFSGCTSASNKAANSTGDPKTQLPNPMAQQTSTAAIKDAIGFTFDSLPSDITDVRYYTISDNLAEADFIANGVSYTVRKGAAVIANVSGVYTNFQSGETKTTPSGAAVMYQSNPDGMGLATWATDDYVYSVYCESGYDGAEMEAVVNGVS
ncbi:hypothetical protein [Acetobacterium woodii]|uniref:Lipoprotein n=1 Tax=Acetobacterium woodii (strain ATCC 29683 / DSM 1030 / JCM 2381 / KCTC 1655 / WB1) TaxID=931626 RepID=H6LFD5_ACEWD|nr:hypothetical protein [Acetobacterium woodii]AFA49422.1 hypothetical protein Awo_c26690 [Acetobacterium woodii DSM 1030]